MERPLDGIQKERALNELKDNADKVVDTTYFTVHQLRDLIKEISQGPHVRKSLPSTWCRSASGTGYPWTRALVMDTRFLPNPFFVDSMRWLDGMDEKVKDFVLSRRRPASS